MRNFVIGFVVGLVVATVGLTGVARMFDKTIDAVKHQSKELAQ
jgi:capsular polysaccharide biosynthesis protein